MRRRVLLVLLALSALPVCATAADRMPAAMPKPRSLSYVYDALDQLMFRPATRAVDPALLVRRVSGRHREAANVDERDQVRLPSTWWQPRLGYHAITSEQMIELAGRGARPASGPWTVVKLKTQGVSPGFQIVDANGTRFAIKFDAPGDPELNTGADVVVSYLAWAAGYNAPQNSIVHFHVSDLVVGEHATFDDGSGHKVPLRMDIIQQVLAKVQSEGNGTYRAVASRFLPGKPLGEWRFVGRRDDDPEDLVPHELRREVRGLWMFYAWVNNTDGSARNTYDSWVTDGGRSFVRHYLIDFSGAMGSASVGPQQPRAGAEYLMDYGTATTSLTTLGLRRPLWESSVDPKLPAVGYWDAATFDASHWKGFLPNPAFDMLTPRDQAWAAQILSAFTDAHIHAAVAMGEYHDPAAVAYLEQTLRERRDKLVARWLPTSTASAAR